MTEVQVLLELQSFGTLTKLQVLLGQCLTGYTGPPLVDLEAQRDQRLIPEGPAAGFLESDSHYQERRSPPPSAAPNEQNL